MTIEELENTVRNLVIEKNKQHSRIKELENKQHITAKSLKIGNFAIVDNDDEKLSGVWYKHEDGRWYKANVK